MSTWKDKRKFDSFEEHLQWVRRSTFVDVKETEEDRHKRKKRARSDFRYFVKEYFPHYAQVESADFHVRDANKILKYPVSRNVLAWFRGAAKSVNADIFLPMWLKIQQPRQIHTMVLVSKSYDQAKTLLSDLQAEFDGNAKYIQDFGQQIQLGSWEEGQFTTKDGCHFHALGRGQSPRGLRKREYRPDFIVLDDIDDDQIVLNQERVKEVINWILRALIPTMDAGQGRVIIANNLIHENSIVSTLIRHYNDVKKKLTSQEKDLNDPVNTHYYISKVNIRDNAGNITWPQKYSHEVIENLELELGYAASQTELYNNPITEGSVFKQEWFQYKKLPPLSRYKDLVAYYDGGFKNSKTSDSKSLILSGLYKGEYHIIKAYVGVVSRIDAVLWHYDLYEWLQSKKASARFYMEEVFILDLLYEDFKAMAEEKGYPIPLMGDKRQKPNKDIRIQAMAGAWERGSAYLNQAEKDNHHMHLLVEQFLAFPKGQKDGPDAVEGSWHLLREQQQSSEPPVIGLRSSLKNKYRF